MYINSDWRILTIGDGDLSFSGSILKHHKPKALTATIYDDQNILDTKYEEHCLELLSNNTCQVFTGIDVTNSETWSEKLERQFDVVFFQFPLIPAFTSAEEYQEKCQNVSMNTLHRCLLRKYLINCFKYFLDINGAGLAFITSKNVNPYRNWQIETTLTLNTDIHYLGSIAFNIDNFPGYKIRNVDRDKHVKCTEGITYVFSKHSTCELDNMLTKYDEPLTPLYCKCCRVGAFATEQSYRQHLLSKKHIQMAQYEKEWLQYINGND